MGVSYFSGTTVTSTFSIFTPSMWEVSNDSTGAVATTSVKVKLVSV